MDPHRLQWEEKKATIPFIKYNVKLERDSLKDKHVIPDLVDGRAANGRASCPCPNVSCGVQCGQSLAPQRKQGSYGWCGTGLIVAVNVWMGRIDNNINTSCPVCP